MPAIKCPHCGASLKISESKIGSTGKCPKCGDTFTAELPKNELAKTAQKTVYVEPVRTLPAAPSAVAKLTGLVGDVARKRQERKAEIALRQQEVIEAQRFAESQPRPCPFCEELILPASKKCKHCGEYLDPAYRPQAAASQQAAPAMPQIVINNSNTASAVAIAGGRPVYTNGLATAAVVLALLALLFSWIPFLGLLSIPAAVLAILVAGLAILLALLNNGAGFLRAVAGGALGLIAIVVAIASTGSAAKSIVDESHKVQARESVAPARSTQPPVVTVAKPVTAPIETKPVGAAAPPIVVSDPAPVTKPDPIDINAQARKKFSSALANGRGLVKARVYPPARAQFQRVIDGAPGTDIATEAQEELDAIAKK